LSSMKVSWDWRPGSKRSGRSLVLGFLVATFFLASLGNAQAQTYEDSRGLYGGMTISLGWNKWAEESGIDSDTMTGFSFMAGYRFNPWLGGDVEFTWVGGGNVTSPALARSGSASILAVGVALKFYPLVRISRKMPEWIQPYVTVGIGSGIAEQTPSGSTVFGSESQSVFLARFGMGSELMLTQNWGVLMDVSYYASTSGALEGFTTFRLGGIFRF
jgi:opacity protein-like surface antigen